MKDTEEAERTIVHESGHALVAWLSSAVFSVNEMRLHETGGKTAFSGPVCRPEHYWERLVIGLAGMAAEVIVFKSVRSGNSRNDLLEAKALAETICKNGRPAPPWPLHPETRGLEFGKMFKPSASDDVALAMNESYKRAFRLIMDNRPGHDRLVAALRKKGVLDRQDIASLFGPRFWGPK